MVGSKVDKFKVGQRVGFSPFRDHCGKCGPCADGNDNLCNQMNIAHRLTFSDEFFGGYCTHFQG